MLLFLFGAGCVQHVRIEEKSVPGGLREYVLSNGEIACGTVPEASGLLASFEYLPGKKVFFEPLDFSVERDDLLPTIVKTGATGARELLWGTKRFHNLTMAVTGMTQTRDTVRISMKQPFFSASALTAEKVLELSAGSTGLDSYFTLTNPEKKPVTALLWCNIIARMGKKEMDPVLMPVKGGVYRVQNRAVTGFEKDLVYQENDHSQIDVFTAPGRPWIARFTREFPGVLVMRCTTPGALGPGARFYSYKRGERTMEFISAPVTLQPGKSYTWHIEYIFFPSLRTLRDVAGVYAIDRIDGKDETLLEIEACKPVAAGKVRIDSGEIFTLPAMKPGKVYRIRLRGSRKNKAISGTLPGNAQFCLNGLFTEKTAK